MIRYFLILILIPVLTFAGLNQIQKVAIDPNPSYDNYDRKEIALSSTLKSVAYPFKKDDKVSIVINGKLSDKVYDCISAVTFLPESERVAFLASTDGCKNLFWVVDGKEYSTFLSSRGRAYAYSKRFNHFAYAAFDNRKEFVVVDGEPIAGRYDKVDFLSYMPDGKTLLYKAREKENEFILIGGKQQKKYKMVRDIRVSASSDIFYLASDEKTEFLVVNGKEQTRFAGGVYSYCTSADGKKVITIANDRRNIIVSLDKKTYKFPLMNKSRALFCRFAPDSRSFAFIAPDEKEPERIALFVNDKKIGTFDELVWSESPSSVAFSPDSLRFAYVVREKNRETLFINEERIVTHDRIYRILFSPDSTHFVYSYQNKEDQIGFSLNLDNIFSRGISSLFESADGPLFIFDGSDRVRYIYEDNTGFYFIEEIVN